MPIWESIPKQSIEYKIKQFNYFKSLGDELYYGYTDHYDDPYYVDYVDYEDDVTEFVESLTSDDIKVLQSLDAGFYMNLVSFYRRIWNENYDSKNDLSFDWEDEDDLNIYYE